MNFTVFSVLLYVLEVLIVGLAGLLIAFVLYLWYVHKIHNHLPGPPRSSFILGHVPAIAEYRKAGKTFVDYLLDNRKKYGPVYVIFVLHEPLVIVGDPAEVKKVCIDLKDHVYKDKNSYDRIGFVYGERGAGYGLVTNTDKKSWRSRRQLMNPAFHRKCLKDFIADFNQVCDRFLERMNCVADSKQEVSMLQEFSNVTLAIISQVSFHVDVGSIENPESPFSKAVTHYFKGMQANFDSVLSPTLLSIYQFRLFQTATQKEQIDATKFLRRFARECVARRLSDIKTGKDVPDDLLSLLVNNALSIDDVIDEFATVFLAGHDTTANTLAFALYEIAKHPDIETKILEEIEDVTGGKDYVDFEDLAKLKYLTKVMQETLRKYPVAGGPYKKLGKEVTIGGYQIPKGDNVVCENYVFSYNPETWKNPEVFDPERFNSPENISNFTSLYFPFSLGPRSCIGQTFAKFEFLVILVRILGRFQFNLLPGQTNAIEERLTLAPRDGVMCKVQGR